MKNNKIIADVYIKDEGYADVKFLTSKAKEEAHKLEIPNSLESFGKKFCGQPVYYNDNPETHKNGMYNCGVKLSHLGKLVKKLQKAGLVIDSEFSLNHI